MYCSASLFLKKRKLHSFGMNTSVFRSGVAHPFLMLKAFFDFAIKITLQALRFQPNRRHQSIQRKNLHYIDIWHFIPGALFFRQNALRHQVPS
jgi:hypothetical protein